MNAPRPPLFDSRAIQLRRARLGQARFLERSASDNLAERLAAVNRRFEAGLCIGDAVPAGLHPFALEWRTAAFDAHEILDAESGRYDLAISILSLQAINDLPGALIQIRRALKPDGLFLGVILGGETLTELRAAFAAAESETLGGISPRVSPFSDVRDLGGLLVRGGFALPVTDVERLTVRYADFWSLARDLRAHGFTNVLSERSRKFLRRDTLKALLDYYTAHHSSDGKLTASFDLVTLTGWAPHQSQQQPLKPGSAKTRLAEALGTVEHKTGER
jgi:SAM-dependent methyltransferase